MPAPTSNESRRDEMISIVIPAYNEERRLGKTLAAIAKYLRGVDFPWEVIVVDDGSSDRTTAIAAEMALPGLRLIQNEENRGKGFTVKRGIESARGAIILFADADNSTPIEEFEKFRRHLASGADVVIGSRALPDSQLEVHQNFLREFAGRTFNRILRLLVGLPFHDTQCGFKAFRCEAARDIFASQSISGWGFDAEILLIAKRRNYQIIETPVRWINSADSRLSIWRDAPKMLIDLLKIRWNDMRGCYKSSASNADRSEE